MKSIDYTHSIRSCPGMRGERIVYIDNVAWCTTTAEAFSLKFLPALDELWQRRRRVAENEADTVLD